MDPRVLGVENMDPLVLGAWIRAFWVSKNMDPRVLGVEKHGTARCFGSAKHGSARFLDRKTWIRAFWGSNCIGLMKQTPQVFTTNDKSDGATNLGAPVLSIPPFLPLLEP